jgi:glutaredoxin
MNIKYFLLPISILFLTITALSAQETVKTNVPVDTVKNKQAIRLIQKLLQRDTLDPLFSHVTVLGNPDCGHCLEMEKMMTEKKIGFDVYDLRDNKLFMAIHSLVVEKEKSPQVSYTYPIIIYKGEVSYSIKEPVVFIEELNKKVKP